MTMPSPFEMGRAVGENISGGITEGRELSSLDKVLQEVGKTGNVQDLDNAMGKILTHISPERRDMAYQVLMQKRDQIMQKQEGGAIADILEKPELRDKINSLSPELRKVVVAQAMKNKYPSYKETHSDTKIIADLVKKSMGDMPGASDKIRGDFIIGRSSSYLQQGKTILDSYALAAKDSNKFMSTEIALTHLNNNFKHDFEIIKKAKKSEFHNDEDLALKLLDKGYSEKDLKKFGINITDVLDAVSKPESNRLGFQKIKFDVSNPEHVKKRDEALKRTAGDKAKANALLAEEFE